MKHVRTVLFTLVVLGFVSTAHAAIFIWSAPMHGALEVPPSASTATGFGLVTFDDITNVLTLELEWNGLTGSGMQSHIHCCAPPGVNAGIAIDIWLIGTPQPATGSFLRVFDLDVDDPFRAAFKDRADVHVLTVHESQGVEFDAVCLVGIPEDFLTVDDPELRKIKRDLLYVALTRAMEELHVFGRSRLSDQFKN